MARKPTKPPSVTSLSSISLETISHSDIAALAYLLWQDRGCPEGSPEKDWYEAERKLQAQTQAQATFA